MVISLLHPAAPLKMNVLLGNSCWCDHLSSSCTFPPNTGCEAFWFKLVSCVGGRKLSLCAHGCLESWNNISVYCFPQRRISGHRVGQISLQGIILLWQQHTSPVYICDCNSFSSTWFVTLFSSRRTPNETREPHPHLHLSFALSVWWILWIQTLT